MLRKLFSKFSPFSMVKLWWTSTNWTQDPTKNSEEKYQQFACQSTIPFTMIIRQFLINKDIETLVSITNTSRFRRLWIIISQATKTRIAEKHRGNLDLEIPLPVGSQMNRRDNSLRFKHETSTRARIILMRVNVVIVEAFFDCYIATLRNEIHRTSSPFNSLLSIRLSRRKSLEYCVIQGTFRSFSFFFPLPIQYNWFIWTIRSRWWAWHLFF